MRRVAIVVVAVVGTFVVIGLASSLHADDPLKAMPTPDDPIAAKVKRLTAAQREAIALPKDAEQVVFSITKGPSAAEAKKPKKEPQLWLKVLADGRIDCTVPLPLEVPRRGDRLTEDELVWLLHLAVNECDGLNRSTAKIDADLAALRGGAPRKTPPGDSFHYRVHLTGKANEFAISENVMTLRPLRAELGLYPFASLHQYASFLIARAFLGSPAQREAILKQVNEKLVIEHPGTPPFVIEHLGAALTMDKVDLSANFMQELELDEKKHRRITATVLRRAVGEEATIQFNVLDFSKAK